MSTLPRFDSVDLGNAPVPADAARRFEELAAKAGTGEAWETAEQIPVGTLFNEDVYKDMDWLDTYAGIPPFVHGPYATMYAFRPWTIRQYAGFSTAKESNAFYRRNLAAGQKGLSVAFDLPPTVATTRTIPASPVTSAWPVWPSTPSMTCASCSPAFRWTR